MSSGRSGLAVAIDGESPAGLSEDGPEPPRIKCRWEPCCTILRIAARPGGADLVRRLKEKDEQEETPPDAKPPRKRGKADKMRQRDKLAGLCLVHQQMVLDYEAGISHVRPPFYTDKDQRQEVTEAGTIIRRKPAKKAEPQEPDPSESP